MQMQPGGRRSDPRKVVLMARELKIPPNCDETFGFRLTSKSQGKTSWTWTPDERWENPAGVIQGGCLGAFADTVMAATVVTALDGRKALVFTADANISYLRAVLPGNELTCDGEIVQIGSRLAFAEAHIRNGEGRSMVKASSTWVIMPRE